MNKSCRTYACIMSHVWICHIKFDIHVNGNRGTHQGLRETTESCRIRQKNLLHMWMSYVAHVNESYRTCKWVVSCVWTSHVTRTHMNASCQTYTRVCVVSHSHISIHIHTYVNFNQIMKICQKITAPSFAYEEVISHIYEWDMSHRYEWVMSHIWISHLAHMTNKSCHTYERLMSHMWMRYVTFVWISNVTFAHIGQWWSRRSWRRTKTSNPVSAQSSLALSGGVRACVRARYKQSSRVKETQLFMSRWFLDLAQCVCKTICDIHTLTC